MADCGNLMPNITSPSTPRTCSCSTDSNVKVLIQNLQLTQDNVNMILNIIRSKLLDLQTTISQTRNKSNPATLNANYTFPSDGGTLRHLLENGVLASRLLPGDCAQSLVLVTDGVLDTSFKSPELNAIMRLMSRDGIHLTSIQVGNGLGFDPGSCFGYVPDNESLRFLAISTCGRFIYSTDCPEPDVFPVYDPEEYLNSYLAPNFYHHNILFQKANLDKTKQDNRYANVNAGTERPCDLTRLTLAYSTPHSNDYFPMSSESSFPWNFTSPPPPTEYVLTRYRDYTLPLDISSIMNARLREGFFVERILLSGNQKSKVDKIHINLALLWLPNVVLQYRIKAQLPNEYQFSQAHLPRFKYIRIEMNVLSYTRFALSFVDIDNAQKMIDRSNPILDNVTSLHDFLKSILSTDDTLKSLSTLIQQFPILKPPKDNRGVYNSALHINSLQDFDRGKIRDVWKTFESERLDMVSNGLFDRGIVPLIIIPGENIESREESLKNLNGYKFTSKDLKCITVDELGFIPISEFTYIKFFYGQKQGQQNFASFCIIRISFDTQFIVNVRLVFVNMRYSLRKELMRKFSNVDRNLTTKSGVKFHLKSYERPLRYLLFAVPRINIESFAGKGFNMFGSPSYRLFEHEKVIKPFLKHVSRGWLESLQNDSYFQEHGYPTINSLVYTLLLKSKLSQGFVATTYNQNQVTFYKEIIKNINGLPCDEITPIHFCIQYHLTNYPDISQVITDIWSEPVTSTDGKFLDVGLRCVQRILQMDQVIVSNLLTFDLVHSWCRENTSLSVLNEISQRVPLRSLLLPSVVLSSSYVFPKPLLIESQAAERNIDFSKEIEFFETKRFFNIRPYQAKNTDSTQVKLELYPTLSEEQLQKFDPFILTYLFFQFFTEESILQISDHIAFGTPDDPCRIPLKKFNPDHHLIPEIASCNWGYAKLISSNYFTLIFIPSIMDLLVLFKNKSINFEDPISIELWSYEVIREDLEHRFRLNVDHSGEKLVELEECNLYTRMYPPRKEDSPSTLSLPDRAEVWTDWSKPQPVVCDWLHKLHNMFDVIMNRTFVQTLYATCLRNQPLRSTDIDKLLSLCDSITIDIDLTTFLLFKKFFSKNENSSSSITDYWSKSHINKRFQKTLGWCFSTVKSNTQDEISSVYYHNPLNEAEQISKNVKLLDIFEKAKHPIFMTFDFKQSVTITNSETQGTIEKLDKSLNSIPLDFDVSWSDSSESDIPQSYIDNEFLKFNSSSDLETQLKMNLHMPTSLDSIVQMSKGLEPSSKIREFNTDSPKVPKEPLNVAYYNHILESCSAQIDWFMKQEMLQELLSWRPLGLGVLEFVHSALDSKHESLESPAFFRMPLSFVRKERGLNLFNQALQRLQIDQFRAKKVGPYFHVFLKQIPEIFKVDGKLLNNGLKLCKNSVIDCYSDNNNEKYENDNTIDYENIPIQPFWLLLYPRGDDLLIYFFSLTTTLEDQQKVLLLIRNYIATTLTHVNQQVLLEELNETRECNRYLLTPPLIPSEYDDNDDDSDDLDEEYSITVQQDNVNLATFIQEMKNHYPLTHPFIPGQFQCPMVLRQTFHLHWRLSPYQALNGIIDKVFLPFSVSNRRNMFVIAEKCSIFYVILSEEEKSTEEEENSIRQPSMVSEPAESVHTGYDDATGQHTHSTVSPVTSIPPSPSNSKRFAFSQSVQLKQSSEGRELIMEIYGIQHPGSEITEDLIELITNRLDNHITLSLISSFLSRNATLKLTKADTQFIFPLHKQPTKNVKIPLPSFIQHPFVIMSYIKQNLLEYLNQLTGPEVKNSFQKWLGSNFQPLAEFENIDECDCSINDFLFYYNSFSSRSLSQIESAIGSGMASIVMLPTLLDKPSNIPKFGISKNDEKSFEFISNMMSLNDYHFNRVLNLEKDEVEFGEFSINFRIWTMGSVDPDMMIAQLHKSIKQSIHDFAIDKFIQSLEKEHNVRIRRDSYTTPTLEANDLDFEAVSKASDDGASTIYHENYFAELQNDSEPPVDLNPLLFKPVPRIIDYSSKMQNTSSKSLSITGKFSLGQQTSIIGHIYEWLSDLHVMMIPAIFELKPSENDNNLDYPEPISPIRLNSSQYMQPNVTESGRFLLCSGLKDLIPKLFFNKPNQLFHQYPEYTPTRRSSSEETGSIKSGFGKLGSIFPKNRDDLTVYTPINFNHNCGKVQSTQAEPLRHNYLQIEINYCSIKIYSYNIEKHVIDQLHLMLQKIVAWINARQSLLDYILLQKLGLFHTQLNLDALAILNIHANDNETKLIVMNSLIHHRYPPHALLAAQAPNSNNASDSRARISETALLNIADLSNFGNIKGAQAIPDETIKKARNTDLRRIYHDIIPKNNQFNNQDPNLDPLQFHGQDFINVLNSKQGQEKTPVNSAKAMTNLFLDLYPIAIEHTLPTSFLSTQMDNFLKHCHFIHFCRIPLFKFKLDNKSSSSEWLFSPEQLFQQNFFDWYSDVAIQILDEYSEYLMVSVDMVHVPLKNEMCFYPYVDQTMLSSEGSIIPDISFSPGYFIKSINGAIVMVKIFVQGQFLKVDVFSNLSTCDSSKLTESYESISIAISELNSKSHAHSFTFDYHVRYLQRWMDGDLQYMPPLNPLVILQSLYKSPLQPGKFCHNSLSHNLYSPPKPFSIRDLYLYITKTPQRYGLKNLYYENKCIGFYSNLNYPPNYRQTLVFYIQQVANSTSYQLFYYVLHVNIINHYPTSAEQIGDPSATLNQAKIEKFIVDKLDEVLEFHRKDTIWRSFQSDSYELQTTDLETFLTEFYHMDLRPVEPSFSELTENPCLSWPEVIDSLKRSFARASRELVLDNYRHLILLNPYDSHFMIYFKFEYCCSQHTLTRPKNIEVNAVSRDYRDGIDKVESEHATMVIRSVLYYMWTTLFTPVPDEW